MSWNTEDEKAWNQTNPFRQHLGVEIDQVDNDGRAQISLTVTPELLQAYGHVHGGVYCVLIDSVLGTCTRSALQRDCASATVELNISFLRGTGPGTLVCRGEIVKAGRSIVVGVADVLDSEGRKLATGRGSFMLRDA